jgi:hypothetical protein
MNCTTLLTEISRTLAVVYMKLKDEFSNTLKKFRASKIKKLNLSVKIEKFTK